jgi:hypothetical protein
MFILFLIKHLYIQTYDIHLLRSSLLLPLIIVGSLITVRALSIPDVMAIFETKMTYNFERICR